LTDPYAGILDEVRISPVNFSSNWVWACYLNQASNAFFNGYGTVQTVTSGSDSPAVRNDPVTSVTTNSAMFNGTLTSTGSSACAVSVYWGTNASAWANTNWFNGGAVDPAWTNNTPFSTNVASGLNPNTLYYYTYAASNAAGTVAAGSPVAFITGEITVQATDASAAEWPQDPCTFTFYRPDWSTGVALTAYYTVGGTASNGVDYSSSNLTGSLTFPVGVSNVAITVAPYNDEDFTEPATDTVAVALAPGGYVIGSANSATATIVNRAYTVAYVATNGLSVAPYDSWLNAATNIQTAVDYAATNGIPVVQLTNHTYVIPGQIFVTNALTVRGSSRTNTVVRRATTGDAAPLHRIFYVDHAAAVVETLTAQDGHANNAVTRGGGFYLIKGLVRDCDIANSRGNGSHLGIGVYLAGSGAVLSNCVVHSCSGEQPTDTGGGVYIEAGALVTHCVLRNNYNARGIGGGAYVNGGTLRWSTVRNNSIMHNNGVGVYVANNAASLVEYCEVRDNTTPSTWWGSGVGVYMEGAGTVRNCLVARNRNDEVTGSASYGGGLYISANSVVENCTVVNNYSFTQGGGIYAAGGTIRNCIFDDNYSPLSPNARTNAGTYVTCLLPGGAPGTGNFDGSAGFVNAAAGDYHLSLLSKGLNAGTDQAWMDTATDLGGGARKLLGQSDIGAYETTNALTCAFSATPSVGVAPLTVNFTATVVGTNTNNLTYFWDFDGNGLWDDSGSDKQATSREYALGSYRPVLWVTNGVGESAIYTGQTAVIASALTLYVATNGTHTVPYDTWGKAATNVQAAIDAAADGARVVLSNGTYTLGAQIVVDKAITLESVNGATSTTLRCASRTYRVLKLDHTNAVVRGLTLDNGYAYELEGGVAVNRRGGGACVLAGRLLDCTVSNSKGSLNTTLGIGVYLHGVGAMASNCVVGSSVGENKPKGGGAYVNTGALMTHCTLRGYSGYTGSGADGAGAYVNGGTLRWCNIYGNSTFNDNGGVGVHVANNAAGLVEYCTITNNVVPSGWGGDGVGVYMAGAGTVRNCLVAMNKHDGSMGWTSRGGGLFINANSVVENCTVVNNNAFTEAGGIYTAGGTNRNCIFYGNTSPLSANARTNAGTYVTCLLPGGAPGTDNIDGSPTFMDAANRDFRLVPTSVGVNAGTDQSWMTGAVDLAGDPRVQLGRSDIGAYEAPATFTCSYTVNPRLGIAPFWAVFSGTATGDNTNGLTYYWDLDGNGTWEHSGADKQTVSNQYALGVYWPVLSVSNAASQGAVYTSTVPVVATLATVYVATNGSATSPYDTWGKAATNVQSAVDVAGDGVRVLVSNGTYTAGAYVTIMRPITLESLNGAAVTTLRCASRSYRVLKLNHTNAVVRGLTLDNGSAYELENGVTEVRRGGGAYIIAGTLADCTITNCFGTAAQGAGFYLASGLVTNCIVRNGVQNGGGAGDVRGIGGFVAGGEVVDCRFSGNTISANVSDNNWGGGLHVASGTVWRCVFYGNTLGYGRGAGLSMAGGLVDRCIVTNNLTQFGAEGGRGGGVYVGGGTLRNTLVKGNAAHASGGPAGGGLYQTGGQIENCTVVTNRATHATGTAGGLYATAGAVTNCIFAYNAAQGGAVADDVLVTGSATIGYSRARELTPGTNGNITDDPRFMGAATNNYTLASDSPCIDGGANQPWMDTAVDLAGTPRRAGRVDMGAYESRWTRGTVFKMR
jgi:hypothetical protein